MHLLLYTLYQTMLTPGLTHRPAQQVYLQPANGKQMRGFHKGKMCESTMLYTSPHDMLFDSARVLQAAPGQLDLQSRAQGKPPLWCDSDANSKEKTAGNSLTC
jgi:hypothetical protein